jgi:peptidoglycan/LPS O-acetylase OafA/YrhL
MLVVVGHMSRFHLGHLAVNVFFVLSGYWITLMWNRKYRYTNRPYVTFIISRAWRILPIFWLMNILAIIVGIRITHVVAFPPFAIFSGLALLGYASLNGPGTYLVPAWSLDIEIQYYLLAPLLLSLLFLAKRTTSSLLLIVAIASVALVVRSQLQGQLGPFMTVFSYLGFFVAGMAHSIWDITPSNKFAAASGLGAIAIIVILLVFPQLRGIVMQKQLGPMTDYNEIGSVLMGFLLVPYAMWTVRRPSDQFDKPMGDMSYILYLFHWPVVGIYGYYVADLPPVQKLIFALLAVTVMAMGTTLIWRYFDRPIDAWRDRFIRKRLLLAHSP